MKPPLIDYMVSALLVLSATSMAACQPPSADATLCVAGQEILAAVDTPPATDDARRQLADRLAGLPRSIAELELTPIQEEAAASLALAADYLLEAIESGKGQGGQLLEAARVELAVAEPALPDGCFPNGVYGEGPRAPGLPATAAARDDPLVIVLDLATYR